MTFLKNFWLDLKEDKIQAVFFILSVALFVVTGFLSAGPDPFTEDRNEIVLYHTNGCPHCAAAVDFVDGTLAREFPEVVVRKAELSAVSKEERDAFLTFVEKHKIAGVPVLKKGSLYVTGFQAESYRAMAGGTLTESANFASCAIGETGDCAVDGADIAGEDVEKLFSNEKIAPSRVIELPVFGKIDVYRESLLMLAVVLGLVDGFNPCAMWVLVFMISVIADLNDKRKTVVIVGSFLAASALFYFALLAGWINLFKLIGYMRLLTVALGAVAVYTGLTSLKSFFEGPVCKVTSAEGRKKIKQRIVDLAEKPLSWATLTGVFLLAVVVNGIEFVCSAALPAIFTGVLAFSPLSTVMHYFYILVYLLFFMLDDIIVFSLAAFAVNKYAGDKYMVWCKFIGGAILLGLGFIMLFKPAMLV